jgi:hypothetical protein
MEERIEPSEQITEYITLWNTVSLVQRTESQDRVT